ncbi:hypothetical protein BH10ACI2_BH10ACI2_01430 [soil metagenome]
MKNIKFITANLIFVRHRFLVSLLCVLCASVVNLSAQDYKTLKDGIEYAEVTKEISGLKVHMNLLRLDLTKVRLDVNHAMDAAIGTEKTSSIATRHGAFAAINAGFFRLDKSIWAGDPAGLLLINGELLSEQNGNRIALGIENNKKKTVTYIAPLQAYIHVGVEGTRLSNVISGIDRERKEKELVLYGPAFGKTTLTQPNGTEVLLKGCKRKFGHRDGIEVISNVCQSLDIRHGTGNSSIPSDGYVLSISPADFDDKTEMLKELTELGPGVNKKKRPFIRFETGVRGSLLPPDSTLSIVGGVPQLIKNSKIDITWQEEKSSKSFVETRHPRTAVAKLKDGKFLMITVDGRTESSGGIGLQDLAEYLLSLGATDAMNLDGGGSTTMFVDGKVVNHPSDKEGERKVSDAILVSPRRH